VIDGSLQEALETIRRDEADIRAGTVRGIVAMRLTDSEDVTGYL